MNRIIIFSGPCGCGKTTLSEAWARRMVNEGSCSQVYVIHGDSFHAGFIAAEPLRDLSAPGYLSWPDILRFNWDCILNTADQALHRGLDVIIDYVVEDELPLLVALARKYTAEIYYIVLTARLEELTSRLAQRGNPELTERSAFLKAKFEHDPTHGRHLYDISGMTVAEAMEQLNLARYRIHLT